MSIIKEIAIIMSTFFIGCTSGEKSFEQDTADTTDETSVDPIDPDLNGDGEINILILGSNLSFKDTVAFSAYQIASELQNILTEDPANTTEVTVAAEDIHTSKPVTIGLGGNGTEYTYTHHIHSLTQYYYWPENMVERMENLKGNADSVWDHIIIGADPQIVSTTPGYYALGVNKIAGKIAEGSAQPHLLMVWAQDTASGAHLEEYIERTAAGAKVSLSVIPAAIAWEDIPEVKRDNSAEHPSPNGAYLTAATIYSHITKKNAASSEYTYDDELATTALSTVQTAEDTQEESTEDWTFSSPFSSCDVSADTITYNHTGSSSENGILSALNWVFDLAEETLENGGSAPSTFNYGRANTNFEANKRYEIDPELYNFSFGFPMQDHGNHGDTSMLYGLDRRDSGVMNDTDLGVATFMIEEAELPYARAIPIRTLFAQMREVIPEQSAYRDSWHMHRDLDKSIAAYMYTLLTGKCTVGEEPSDAESEEWRTWTAHKIGYDTAWTLMTLQGTPPY